MKTNDITTEALHGAKRDLKYAYEHEDSDRVTEQLIALLQDVIPESELSYVVDYLHHRLDSPLTPSDLLKHD